MRQQIDRDLLHEYMWDHSDPRTHEFEMTQIELAEALLVTNATISHIFNEFKVAGRIRKKGFSFYVIDPAIFQWRKIGSG